MICDRLTHQIPVFPRPFPNPSPLNLLSVFSAHLSSLWFTSQALSVTYLRMYKDAVMSAFVPLSDRTPFPRQYAPNTGPHPIWQAVDLFETI